MQRKLSKLRGIISLKSINSSFGAKVLAMKLLAKEDVQIPCLIDYCNKHGVDAEQCLSELRLLGNKSTVGEIDRILCFHEKAGNPDSVLPIRKYILDNYGEIYQAHIQYLKALKRTGASTTDLISAAKQFCSAHPNNYRSYSALAFEYRAAKRFEEAISCYEKALSFNSKSNFLIKKLVETKIDASFVEEAFDFLVGSSIPSNEKMELSAQLAKRAFNRGARGSLLGILKYLLENGNDEERFEAEIMLSTFSINLYNMIEPNSKSSYLKIIKQKSPKSIVVVINMDTFPYSIGECIYTYVAANSVRRVHSGKRTSLPFKVVFYADPAKPDRGDQKVSLDSYFPKVFDLMAITKAIEGVQEVALFNDKNDLKAYLAKEAQKSIFWPPLADVTEGVQYYRRNCEVMQNIHVVAKIPPRFPLSTWARKRALEFIREHCKKSERPIAVHLRVNENHFDSDRNSRLSQWTKFFASCVTNFPGYKFFIVCGQAEARHADVVKLSKLRNVVLCKQYYSDVAVDLAMCSVSSAFLGGMSGPPLMAQYSDIPFVMFNCKRKDNFHFYEMFEPEPFPHGLENQTVVWEPERYELMMELFVKMVRGIDWEKERERIWRSDNDDSIDMHVLS